jgi:hypothetical protein
MTHRPNECEECKKIVKKLCNDNPIKDGKKFGFAYKPWKTDEHIESQLESAIITPAIGHPDKLFLSPRAYSFAMGVPYIDREQLLARIIELECRVTELEKQK